MVDLCAYADPTIIDSLYLDESGPRGSVPPVELRRYTIDLAGGSVRSEPHSGQAIEPTPAATSSSKRAPHPSHSNS